MEATMLQETTAEKILYRLSDLTNHPDEGLTPYKEFSLDGRTYYFTPGGFLYRKDAWSEQAGAFFCSYLPDEIWRYRTDDG